MLQNTAGYACLIISFLSVFWQIKKSIHIPNTGRENAIAS